MAPSLSILFSILNIVKHRLRVCLEDSVEHGLQLVAGRSARKAGFIGVDEIRMLLEKIFTLI